jgi:hypothetical protein
VQTRRRSILGTLSYAQFSSFWASCLPRKNRCWSTPP